MFKVKRTLKILKSAYLIIQVGNLKPGDKARGLVGDRSDSGLSSGLPNQCLYLSFPLTAFIG